jgi:hypothetical protein
VLFVFFFVLFVVIFAESIVMPNTTSEFDLESLRHPVKRPAVDAEDFRRALAIAASGVEDIKQITALHFVNRRQSREKRGQIIGPGLGRVFPLPSPNRDCIKSLQATPHLQ